MKAWISFLMLFIFFISNACCTNNCNSDEKSCVVSQDITIGPTPWVSAELAIENVCDEALCADISYDSQRAGDVILMDNYEPTQWVGSTDEIGRVSLERYFPSASSITGDVICCKETVGDFGPGIDVNEIARSFGSRGG